MLVVSELICIDGPFGASRSLGCCLSFPLSFFFTLSSSLSHSLPQYDPSLPPLSLSRFFSPLHLLFVHWTSGRVTPALESVCHAVLIDSVFRISVLWKFILCIMSEDLMLTALSSKICFYYPFMTQGLTPALLFLLFFFPSCLSSLTSRPQNEIWNPSLL